MKTPLSKILKQIELPFTREQKQEGYITEFEYDYMIHAANSFPALVEALKGAIKILDKQFDYRPDDDGEFEAIKKTLNDAQQVEGV